MACRREAGRQDRARAASASQALAAARIEAALARVEMARRRARWSGL
jgi:hypothetical protein